jgi:hypothetical protein
VRGAVLSCSALPAILRVNGRARSHLVGRGAPFSRPCRSPTIVDPSYPEPNPNPSAASGP